MTSRLPQCCYDLPQKICSRCGNGINETCCNSNCFSHTFDWGKYNVHNAIHLVLFSQSNVCRHNICEVVWCLPLLLLLLFLFSQGLAEVNFSLYMFFSSINVVVYSVCSHCSLQASLVQYILYVRVLLFVFISFIFSCMTCMKIIGNDCNK